MLSEAFIACCGPASSTAKKSSKPSPSIKDASIAIHGLAPQVNVKQTFKKSVVAPNCLAVSNEHIFAAQADKAVVNVYSRERGNHECLIPFQEGITALAMACDGAVLVMGTESGRLMLWETCTGRLVSTSAAHLQGVTCIAVSPDSKFIISGSDDSTLHTWSVASLLSFGGRSEGRSPLASMTSHRAGITALAVSSISNQGAIAISAASDGTAIVFDYVRGALLRTVVLTEAPTCLVLDLADRGFFAGFQDGSIQLIDFYESETGHDYGEINPLYASEAKLTPVQPSASSRWRAHDSAILDVALSWDGMTLVSGHASGLVSTWDVGLRQWKSNVVTMIGPVTNVQALPLEGWDERPRKRKRHIKVDKVVKPKFEMDSQQRDDGQVPGNYACTAQLLGDLDEGYVSAGAQFTAKQSEFDKAFACDTGFPQDVLEDSLAEFTQWRQHVAGLSYTSVQASMGVGSTASASGDFMSLDDPNVTETGTKQKAKSAEVPKLSLVDQNVLLRKKLAALQRVQRVTFRQLDDLRGERDEYLAERNVKVGAGTAGVQRVMEGDGPSAQLTAEAENFVEAQEEEDAEEQSDEDKDEDGDENDDEEVDVKSDEEGAGEDEESSDMGRRA